MNKPQVLFFGSFQHYSALILEQLAQSKHMHLLGVITTSPALINQKLVPNPTHQLATKLELPVLTPETLDSESLAQITHQFPDVEYFVTAGYGKLLPPEWLDTPTLAALNLHFSLLPKYRGANPAEWALLRGETDTGVTLIEMSPQFDTGKMVAQSTLKITANDTRISLYQKLYQLGAEVLPEMLLGYHQYKTNTLFTVENQRIDFSLPPLDQPEDSTPYARRLVREDGFVSWESLVAVQQTKVASEEGLSPTLKSIYQGLLNVPLSVFLDRAIKALAGFPGVWTKVMTGKGEKRLKILSSSLGAAKVLQLGMVQLEGKAPSKWNEIKNSIISASNS